MTGFLPSIAALPFTRLGSAMAAANIYRPGYCNENVASLVRGVMTPDERREAFVLLMTHTRAATPELYWRNVFRLRPSAAVDPTVSWKHHTVALLGGLIYDYDYRGRPGTPLRDYAFDMFAKGLDRYVVREIPAEEYVSKYKIRDMIFGENYPRRLLGDYAAQGLTAGK